MTVHMPMHVVWMGTLDCQNTLLVSHAFQTILRARRYSDALESGYQLLLATVVQLCERVTCDGDKQRSTGCSLDRHLSCVATLTRFSIFVKAAFAELR